MTSNDFVNWLKGYAAAMPAEITPADWKAIQQELQKVQSPIVGVQVGNGSGFITTTPSWNSTVTTGPRLLVETETEKEDKIF